MAFLPTTTIFWGARILPLEFSSPPNAFLFHPSRHFRHPRLLPIFNKFSFLPSFLKKPMKKAGIGPTLSNAQKGRSEEQIHSAEFPANLVKKALKEKSQSQSAIRVGPFAAIREAECEKRRQKNGSLDLMDEAGEMPTDGGNGINERAATMNGGEKPPNSRNQQQK